MGKNVSYEVVLKHYFSCKNDFHFLILTGFLVTDIESNASEIEASCQKILGYLTKTENPCIDKEGNVSVPPFL